MSNSISNQNAKTSTLNTVAQLRENINCIKKLGLPLSIVQHINSRLIFNDAHINDPIIASDIELHFYVLHYLESYQLNQILIIDYMLEIFCEEFYR